MKSSSYEVAFFETTLKIKLHPDSGAMTKVKDSSNTLSLQLLSKKRVAGILYLCYRTRIVTQFNFEFGFKKKQPHQKIFSWRRFDRNIHGLTSRSYFSKKGNPQRKIFTNPDYLLSICRRNPSRKAFSQSVLITASP